MFLFLYLLESATPLSSLCRKMDKIIFNNIQFYKIKDFPNYYISKCGKVYSSINNIIMSSKLKNKLEYKKVTLRNKNNIKKINIHRLVAESFIPNPENKRTVNHIDRNKHNNNMDNLEWCTDVENVLHSFKLIGKKKNKYYSTGAKHFRSKKILQYDFKGNFIKEWDCIRHAEITLTGKYNTSICICCQGKLKSALGYVWKYYTPNYKFKIETNLIKKCLYCQVEFVPQNTRTKFCCRNHSIYYNRNK